MQTNNTILIQYERNVFETVTTFNRNWGGCLYILVIHEQFAGDLYLPIHILFYFNSITYIETQTKFLRSKCSLRSIRNVVTDLSKERKRARPYDAFVSPIMCSHKRKNARS